MKELFKLEVNARDRLKTWLCTWMCCMPKRHGAFFGDSSRFDPFGAPGRSKMLCILSNPAGNLWTFTLRHKQKRPPERWGPFLFMAESEGFEPPALH